MEPGQFSMTRKQMWAVAITAVLIALTRFASLSLTPWDWDEVLFCLALRDYNVAAHQPHPPGFPLYIVLGKIARLFADSDFHALQAVNVVTGMCTFPVVFWLARSLRMDFHGAMASGVLFAFLPNVWFFGGTAFSDLPAAVLFLAAIAAYLTAMEKPRHYVTGAIFFAAGILVRPQNGPVAVFPWTIATLKLLREKRYRLVITGTVVLALLVAIGFGAAMVATGVPSYITALTSHSKYVKAADSVANTTRPPLLDVLLIQLDPYEAGKVAILMNVLAAIGILFGRRRLAAEVLLTFAPFFVFAWLVVNPLGSSRFSLNYIAAIVLLCVEGATVLGRLAAKVHPHAGVAIRAGIVAVIVGRIGTWVIPAFEVPRTTIAPPVAAAMWLDKNVPPSSTIFVHESIWPWVRYFAPRHKQVRHGEPGEIVTHADAAHGWFIATAPTTASTAIQFVRPRTRTWNIVAKRAFEAFVQPAANVVKFDKGWYLEEAAGTEIWRWSGRRAQLLLGPLGGTAELRLKFTIPLDSVPQPVHVTFTYNGQLLQTLPITEADNEVRFVVPARADRANVLRLESNRWFVPAHHGSHDQRELAIMLRSWSWQKLK